VDVTAPGADTWLFADGTALPPQAVIRPDGSDALLPMWARIVLGAGLVVAIAAIAFFHRKKRADALKIQALTSEMSQKKIRISTLEVSTQHFNSD
jgi:hypothetical protein